MSNKAKNHHMGLALNGLKDYKTPSKKQKLTPQQ
jgi:hypothetical protein